MRAIKKFKPYKGESDPKRHPTSPGRKPLEWTHDHNWPSGEYGCREDLGEKTITALYEGEGISDDLIQEFDEEYVPHAEGWNLHTIYEIYTVRFGKKLFSNNRGWDTV